MLLRPLALGDVLYLRDEVAWPVLAIADQRYIQQNRDQMSARVDVAFLHLVGANLTGDHPAHILQIAFEILRMGDVLEGTREQFRFRIADQIAERPVDFEPSTFGRHQSHADARLLERIREAFFTFAQCLLRAARSVMSVTMPVRRISLSAASRT